MTDQQISVIIPCHNAVDTITAQLVAVADQLPVDAEIVVVDASGPGHFRQARCRIRCSVTRVNTPLTQGEQLGVGSVDDRPASVVGLRSTFSVRVAQWFAAGTLVVFFAHAATIALDAAVDVASVRDYFDPALENNLPTWWNGLLLALIAVSALVVAAVEPRSARTQRTAWSWIAGISAFLSLDEVTSLHERLKSGVDIGTRAWVVPGAALALCGAAWLIWVCRKLPRHTTNRLLIALVVYGAGALGVEAASGWISETTFETEWFSVARIVVEETLEMGACVWAIAVVVDALHVRRAATGVTIQIA